MVKAGVITIGAALMISMCLWIAVGVISVAGVETPGFELIEARDGYEVREYAPHIVAEVTVSSPFRQGMNDGFRQLADYIFGNNRLAGESEGASQEIAMTAPVIEREAPGVEIAMTAPVQEQSDGEERRIVSFVMPREYTMDTLPQPNNPAIRLVEKPAIRYAVLTFSGSVSESVMRKRKAELMALAERDELRHTGQPMLCQYDPPWTPPFMRKNEIWLQLEEAAPDPAGG